MALANIHNMLDVYPEFVLSQVLNLTWFQKRAEVTKKACLGNKLHPGDWMKTYSLTLNSQDNQQRISSSRSSSLSHTITQSNSVLTTEGTNSRLAKTWIQSVPAVNPRNQRVLTEVAIKSACLKRNTELHQLGHRHCIIFNVLPLKDRKILGADRGSLGGGSPPDDKASRASNQHSLSHNIVPLFVNRDKGESRSWGTDRDDHQTMSKALSIHKTRTVTNS